MDRRRRNSLAASPLADRRGHDADRRRRRVPLLQRQQRPPVRADLQHQSRAARGLGPAALQPGPDRRHAGRRGQLADALPGPEDRQADGDRQPEARKERRKAPRGHPREVALGLGDRAEVPRTRKGDLARDAEAPAATIPTSQTREPVDIEELFNMFDHRTRTAIKINTNNFGDGLAGRGLGLNNTIHELRPLVTNAIPVLNNLAAPQTGLRELFMALDRASAQAAPVAEAQASLLRRPGHVLHRLCERDQAARRSDRGRPGIARSRRPTRCPTRRR